MNDQEYYETVSGKFAAYELILAHLLRKTMGLLTEKDKGNLIEDLNRQMNIYQKDLAVPAAARLELRQVVTDVLTKVQIESQTL